MVYSFQRKGFYAVLIRFLGEILFAGGARSYFRKLKIPRPSDILLAWGSSLLKGLLEERVLQLRQEGSDAVRPTQNARTSRVASSSHHTAYICKVSQRKSQNMVKLGCSSCG